MENNNIVKSESFVVIGAGPSGCVLAAFLASGGYKVILCDVVDDLVKPALKKGIILEYCKKKLLVQPVSTIANKIEDLELEKLNVKFIFVSTKATSLPLVADELCKIHRDGVYIISWQNGIDTEMELAKKIDKKWIMRAVVNYGCSLLAPAHVLISFHHFPHYLQGLGSLSKNVARDVAKLMTNCGLATEDSGSIKAMVWKKAILNAAMNPVCAVTGLTMYQSMRNSHVFMVVNSLLKECILIAERNNIDLGSDYYNVAIEYMKNAGDHKPSMLMDIENYRNTEIDYINGKFVEYGSLVGLETPFNTSLRSLVKGKEIDIEIKKKML